MRQRHPCFHEAKGAVLEQGYWLRREREELALAWISTCAEAKLIHFDLAGRYSMKAGKAGASPRSSAAKIELAEA